MTKYLKWQEAKFTWKVHYFNICSRVTKVIFSPSFSLDSLGHSEFGFSIFFERGVDGQLHALFYLVDRKSRNEAYDERELSIQLKLFVGDEEEKPMHLVSKNKKAGLRNWLNITSLKLCEIFKEDNSSQVNLTILLNINPDRNEVKANEIWSFNSEDAESLSSDFSRALEDQKYSDFILKCNGNKFFNVHKSILTVRYPNLGNALGLQKGTTKEHFLCKDALTLKYLLQYLYSGKADVKNVPHEIHGVLNENKLLHLHRLLYPVPESTIVETKVNIRNVGFTWTIENFIDRPKNGTLCNYFSLDVLNWAKLKITCDFDLNEKKEDCLAFSINRIFTETPVYVACKIEILGSMECVREYEHIFEKESEWILLPYVPTKFLIDNKDKFLTSGALTIRFLIQISDGTYTHEVICVDSPKIIVSQRDLSAMNSYNLQRDFKELYKNATVSDVTIHVHEETFRAHKVILSARSSVFSKMCEHEIDDKQSEKIVIKDFKPVVVQAMLSYMYCGEVDNIPQDLNFVMDLYSITDKYEIPQLKKKCVTYFKKELDAENVGKILILADDHKDSHLKTYVKNFVCSNAEEVLLSKNWKQIMRERSDLAADMLHSALSFIVDENSDN